MDVPVDLLSIQETVERVEQAIVSRRSLRHVALNVAKLMNLRNDQELRRDVVESDIVGIDGMGIVYALRLFGVRNVERVAGVDLMFALLDHCAKTGRRPFILGARSDVLVRASERAQQHFPGLQLAGLRDGYFSDDDETEIVDEIRKSNADCLFVAMPTPKKERFLNKHAHALGVPFTMGVGGSVDVLAQLVPRAPLWMQRCGFEWLHRLIMEPRKMAWRYVSTNSLFAVLLMACIFRGHRPVRQ